MSLELLQTGDAGQRLPETIERRVRQLVETQRPRYRRLWNYYRNSLTVSAAGMGGASGRPYVQAQEWGLPPRITGRLDGVARKEVVIENDIGWRIETAVDYLFGQSIIVRSTAANAARRKQIEGLLAAILEHNGGISFLQQLAQIGAVYGFVDVLVKLEPEEPSADDTGSSAFHAAAESALPSLTASAALERPVALARRFDEQGTGAASTHSPGSPWAEPARRIRLEIVEPARALPFLDTEDWRRVALYGQCWEMERDEPASWLDRLGRRWRSDAGESQMVELIGPGGWRRYRDGRLEAAGGNSLGRIPLVHIQNVAAPFGYSGSSDVEPLIPLQDELNTRLSDRAHRITLQSFKMYLGKHVQGFTQMPVTPGQMWTSDDSEAEILEFGGDASCPSEDKHIDDLREAMDKVSGVSPIAAGAIKNRIGRLTSAAALRVTLMALLARTERKRTTYGQGIERICELALAWLDQAGLFASTPAERGVELSWPSPLPQNDLEKLEEAQIKLRVGVPREQVLRELGY